MSETYLVDSDLSMNVPIWLITSTFAFHYYVGARLEAPTLFVYIPGIYLFDSLNRSESIVKSDSPVSIEGLSLSPHARIAAASESPVCLAYRSLSLAV